MYAQREEDCGLAKRVMSIYYDRATQVIENEDKCKVSYFLPIFNNIERYLMIGWSTFKMFTIYIAKAAANYGLTATRPIYERAMEVLPDRQKAKICLRFTALERKLGETDRARAISRMPLSSATHGRTRSSGPRRHFFRN
jgi:pre-mRNA-splicing factor SYF1